VDGKRIYEVSHRTDLAEAIFNEDFPRFLEPVELDHYTTLASLEGIARTGQLHLSSITRWLENGEFTTFANEHDLSGYTEPRQPKPLYQELAEDLFFGSFTSPGRDDPQMWEEFAHRARGVRIRFCVNPLRADLRKVGYSEGQQTAFSKINSILKREQELVYTPWGISRICAFYLGSGYKYESEARLLIKRYPGGPDNSLDGRLGRVWPIEVVEGGARSQDLFCNLELLSVTRAPRASKDAVQSILSSTRFSSVPIYDP
jgi:hypothetical protein